MPARPEALAILAHPANPFVQAHRETCYSCFSAQSVPPLWAAKIKNKRDRNGGRMPGDRKPEFFAGKDVKIGIIGCGYVGLPLALRFADVGQRVTGFDTDQVKVDKAQRGRVLHPAHSRGKDLPST
jgi:hypothetical protein